MNTQNTPVHIQLWNRDFWLMSIASLLMTVSVYIFIPIMPVWLMENEHFTPIEAGRSMGVFGLGLYSFGAICSWLVQRFRRNMVYLWSMVVMAACVASLWYIDLLRSQFVEFTVIMVQRFLLGATFGLSQMVLSSTLIIDTCESSRRTEANHCSSWFTRLALAIGPFTGLLLIQYLSFTDVALVAASCALAAIVLVHSISFPFRTPEETVHVASLDRFLLTQGMLLFLNFLLVTTALGMIMTLKLDYWFYALLMGGFIMAMLAQRYVFRDAELKSEIVSGLIMLIAALLALLVAPSSPVAPMLIGCGVSIIASRFLMFFIKLSRHCQRGTSQSTYFLGWESGIALGLAVGYALFYDQSDALIYTALVLTSIALAMYHFLTHQWFMKHKNR